MPATLPNMRNLRWTRGFSRLRLLVGVVLVAATTVLAPTPHAQAECMWADIGPAYVEECNLSRVCASVDGVVPPTCLP